MENNSNEHNTVTNLISAYSEPNVNTQATSDNNNAEFNNIDNNNTNAISDNNLQAKHEEAIIKVFNPIKKDGIKPYVIYSLKFTDNPDDMTYYRRFSDFFALRSKLVERWPGVYIPNIPPKKTMNNLDSKLVDMRMKLLNKFCEKLSKFPTIFNSEEMRIFLTAGNNKNQTPIDIKKALASLPPQSYEEILLKYKRAFPDYYESYESQPSRVKILDFHNFLKKALVNLKNFKDVVQNSMVKKQQEIENYLALINVFSDYEKYTLLEYSGNDDNKLVFFNPKNNELCLKLLKLVKKYLNINSP